MYLRGHFAFGRLFPLWLGISPLFYFSFYKQHVPETRLAGGVVCEALMGFIRGLLNGFLSPVLSSEDLNLNPKP